MALKCPMRSYENLRPFCFAHSDFLAAFLPVYYYTRYLGIEH